jgi:DNA-binding beta-propeller fold protein YncE
MRHLKFFLLFVFNVLLLMQSNAFCQGDFKPYHFQKAIKIHDSYGWDYLTADDKNRNILISHGIEVLVIGMDNDTVVTHIDNTIGIHGIALNSNLNKAFTSNGRTNSITVFNINNFHTFDTIAIDGKNPDAILYDNFSNQIFTCNAKSHDITVIDPLSMKTNATIELNGKPEFAVTNGRGYIFVNIEDNNEIVQIDSREKKIVTHWSIAPGNEPSGLAIDTINHLLFSVCDNKTLVVSSYADKKIITTIPIGEHPDAVVFDPTTRIIYSSNGEGNVSIIQQVSATEYKLLQNLTTQKGCRTMAIDKRTKKIYLPAAQFETGKRRMIPNTFEVLVFSNQ